jgi:NAD(P)-dependent dehydrogenase (short-subunit alcohol dehydrogenase family)
VYLLGRRKQNLEDAAKSINPDIIRPVQCDVTDPSSIDAAVKQIEKESSHIDVLINNAGVLGPDHKGIDKAQSIQELQEIMKRDWSSWDTSFQTNTAAIVSVSAAFLHLLDEGNKKRGWATGRKEVQERAEGADLRCKRPENKSDHHSRLYRFVQPLCDCWSGILGDQSRCCYAGQVVGYSACTFRYQK